MSDDSTNTSRRDDGGSAETIRSQYDWSTISPSTAVVETVATAVDRETTDLDSLYETLDPDALDTIVQSNRSTRALADTTVSFTFAGRRVTVHSTGEVVVAPGTDRGRDGD